MSDHGTELDAQDVRALFQELSDRLAANEVHAPGRRFGEGRVGVACRVTQASSHFVTRRRVTKCTFACVT